jgi:hypothetical protein
MRRSPFLIPAFLLAVTTLAQSDLGTINGKVARTLPSGLGACSKVGLLFCARP